MATAIRFLIDIGKNRSNSFKMIKFNLVAVLFAAIGIYGTPIPSGCGGDCDSTDKGASGGLFGGLIDSVFGENCNDALDDLAFSNVDDFPIAPNCDSSDKISRNHCPFHSTRGRDSYSGGDNIEIIGGDNNSNCGKGGRNVDKTAVGENQTGTGSNAQFKNINTENPGNR